MADLRIAKVDAFQVDLPFSGGVHLLSGGVHLLSGGVHLLSGGVHLLSGGREYRSFDATIVRITTDSGLGGWGESTPFGSTCVAADGLAAHPLAAHAPGVLGEPVAS